MSAEDFFKKAEGKLNKLLFKDYEGAYENFLKAGAQYKLDKNYDKAGESYMRAGDVAVKLKNPGDSAECYSQAATCYKKTNMSQAGVMLQAAIAVNIENNRLGAAARLEKDFAEALEADDAKEEAVAHYRKAIQYFEAEDQNQAATGCLSKIGKIFGEIDRFEEAVEIYEQLGNKCIDTPLKFQAKEHFLRATICRLALINNDNRSEAGEEVQDMVAHYEAVDIYLKNTRESEFLHLVSEAVAEGDVEKFDLALSLLQELRMLDDWKTHVLRVIQQKFDDTK
jgi:alpha-soluble NSF attachment protein